MNQTILDKHLNFQNHNWERYYKHNTTNGFKDRHYIMKEFPELKNDERENLTFLDIGCGVGNSFYPLIERKPNLKVNAFDISKRAVEMAKVIKILKLKINFIRHIHYMIVKISN